MSDEPRIRINGDEYEIPVGLTLGEQRAIKRVSGMRWEDVANELQHGDPDALTGFLFAVLRRRHPDRSEAALVAEIEQLTEADIEMDEQEEEQDARPPADGSSGSQSPVTTLDRSGTPRSGLSAISAPGI